MADVAGELKSRFWLAELFILEKWEMVGVNPDGKSIPDVWSDEEVANMEMFKALRATVDAIPSSVIEATTILFEKRPDLFERVFVSVTQAVGSGFFPKTAAEFVNVLNLNIERVASFA
jgi:hypothetical protein